MTDYSNGNSLKARLDGCSKLLRSKRKTEGDAARSSYGCISINVAATKGRHPVPGELFRENGLIRFLLRDGKRSGISRDVVFGRCGLGTVFVYGKFQWLLLTFDNYFTLQEHHHYQACYGGVRRNITILMRVSMKGLKN